MKLSDHLKLTREERTAHIDLTTPCELNPHKSPPKKKAILRQFGLEDDVQNWKEARIERCHLCSCDSTHGWCVNPLHQYIGTASENRKDQSDDVLKDSGRRLGLMSASDETRARMSASARKRTDDRGAVKKEKPVVLVRKSDGRVFEFKSQREAAQILGVNEGNLSAVISGKRRSVSGFKVHSQDNSPQ